MKRRLQPKKPRVSGSRSRSSRDSPSLFEVGFPEEDFEELFSGSKVSAGSGTSNVNELWVDKYKPHSLEELAVHKKKVEEVKSWFEERLKTTKGNLINNVIVINGKAGVGKSTTVHVIASHFGARLCEWNTPTPTIWQEHVHNTNTGIQYTSKLDEFVNFIEKIRKYGLIPSSSSEDAKPSIILLIDDLPMTNGRVAFERLQSCLLHLVRSTQLPTAILVSDYDETDSTDHTTQRLEQLRLSLENAGACKVSFNPITINSIKKTLSRICRQEKCSVTDEQLDLIAKASGGDIRHAITSLQLFCVKPYLVLNGSFSTPSYSYRKEDDIDALVSGISLLFGRDETLSLFHALGKFLHNKRETEVANAITPGDAFLVRENFSRLSLKMDAPEKVLCQAHGQARPVTDFLHENVLDFISDEAMDDAWHVSSYLSDSDLLLSSFRGMLARYNEAENVLQSAAASVAVRGVLYGNSHPSPPRWHAIRKPKLWQVEKSMLHKQKEIVRQRFIAYNGSSSSNVSDVATEYMPVLKWLECRASGFEDNQAHVYCNKTHDESCDRMSLDDKESDDDDEIEEW
ncbi:hypothetical protein OIU84_006127 [Salix udensis]|uniref:Cell cycle checkpoint protein RAD17 n=1 Tax=Salix udensis TaxID=889485 RepID=A0AAD6JYL4_9ROSI|nr:hypothetical protein OIU84_006127 [Salix udensis]